MHLRKGLVSVVLFAVGLAAVTGLWSLIGQGEVRSGNLPSKEPIASQPKDGQLISPGAPTLVGRGLDDFSLSPVVAPRSDPGGRLTALRQLVRRLAESCGDANASKVLARRIADTYLAVPEARRILGAFLWEHLARDDLRCAQLLFPVANAVRDADLTRVLLDMFCAGQFSLHRHRPGGPLGAGSDPAYDFVRSFRNYLLVTHGEEGAELLLAAASHGAVTDLLQLLLLETLVALPDGTVRTALEQYVSPRDVLLRALAYITRSGAGASFDLLELQTSLHGSKPTRREEILVAEFALLSLSAAEAVATMGTRGSERLYETVRPEDYLALASNLGETSAGAERRPAALQAAVSALKRADNPNTRLVLSTFVWANRRIAWPAIAQDLREYLDEADVEVARTTESSVRANLFRIVAADATNDELLRWGETALRRGDVGVLIGVVQAFSLEPDRLAYLHYDSPRERMASIVSGVLRAGHSVSRELLLRACLELARSAELTEVRGAIRGFKERTSPELASLAEDVLVDLR